jgi:hypothetical protein
VTSLPEKSLGFIPSKAERSKEKNAMSEIFLKLTIANIQDPQRKRELSFLVDTGATRAWISQEVAEAVGIEKTGTVPLELAVADPATAGMEASRSFPMDYVSSFTTERWLQVM